MENSLKMSYIDFYSKPVKKGIDIKVQWNQYFSEDFDEVQFVHNAPELKNKFGVQPRK